MSVNRKTKYIKYEDALNAICEACYSLDDEDYTSCECYQNEKDTFCDYKQFLSQVLPANVRENVIGKWVWNDNSIDWGIGAWECNKCRFPAEASWATDRSNNPMMYAGGHYCGCCGAEMRGVESGNK